MSSTSLEQNDTTSLQLELGDIIEIVAPRNQQLHEENFFIDYIDSNKLILINLVNEKEVVLTLERNSFEDESIQTINILSRSQEKGYVKQQELKVNTWIDIHFDLDVPYILTGEITDIIEDMIEVQAIDTNEKLYIDFAYKGVPETLYIKKIETRDTPKLLKQHIPEELSAAAIEEDEGKLLGYAEEAEKNIETELDELLFEADQIVFGEVFEDIAYLVDVDETEKRFALEEQISDLYDDIIASVPISQRTYNIENEIHRDINRFCELRDNFSISNNQGIELKKNDKGYRPILKNIKEMNDLPFWLMPIANNKKKLLIDSPDETLPNEILPFTYASFIESLNTVYANYVDNVSSSNRYIELVNNLHDSLMPFGVDGIEQKIYDVNVSSNITAIIENNEHFNSYVYSNNKNINNYLFLQETYLPETYYNKLGGAQNDTYIKDVLTKSDKISLKGFLTLPFNYVDYSRLFNKKSSILTKSVLNTQPFLLSEILKIENITSNIVDNNTESLLVPNKKSQNFFKTISDHRIVGDDFTDDSFDIFLEKVIPKNSDFISNLIQHKKDIFTLKSFIDNLETFRIYDDVLVAKDVEQMSKILTRNVRQLKTQIQNRAANMKQISTLKYNTNYIPSQIMKLIQHMGQRTNEIVDAYNIPQINYITDSEYMHFMSKEDNMKLLGDILSSSNLKLYIDTDVKQAVEEYKLKLKKQNEAPTVKSKNDLCKTYTLSKKYQSIEDVESDNGVEVYYDIDYDSTPYILKDDYNNEYKTMTDDDFFQFLNKKLKDNLGYDDMKSNEIAKDIIRGNKIVQNGVYAFLTETDENSLVSRRYFIRRENSWIEERIDSEEVFVDNSKTLCNIQQECIVEDNPKNNDHECVSIETSDIKKKTSFTDQIIDDYRTNLMISKEDMSENINRSFEKNYKNIIKMRSINKAEALKYDSYYKKIGNSVVKVEIVISPYHAILSKILSQTDFTKRQTDIIRFCEQFTYIPSSTEDQNWLYCNKTFIKLIPSYLQVLALAYSHGNYNLKIDRICAERGQLSDDQSSWIDKHSGYIIKNVEYTTDEGYDDTGFKSISRGVLERDLGDDIVEVKSVASVKAKEDTNTKMVRNVLRTLVDEIGISIDESTIIIDIISAINRTVTPEDQSKKDNEKKLHQVLLYYCISYLFILLQTSIPSIKTRKTFPTCVRSFSGYPLESDADTSGLEYLCCVAIGLKSSIKPWNILKGKITPAALVPKIKTVMDKYVLTNNNIKKLITSKKIFLKKNNESMREIPDEHRVERWSTFLPPLAKLKKESIGNIGSTFKEETTRLIKSGKRHTHKIDALQYKIFRLSLNIQASVNEIVAKAPLLMSNSSNSPFIENACCNETAEYNTKTYFTNYDDKINVENRLIDEYTILHNNIKGLSKASILFDNRNTKIVLPNTFNTEDNEDLRYMAFIAYCGYNLGEEIPDHLKTFCQKRPMNFKTNASVFDKIKNLKMNGINYDKGAFTQLLNVINTKNQISIKDFNKSKYNEQERFSLMIDMLMEDPDIEQQVLLQHINNEIIGKNKKGVGNELTTYLMRINSIIKEDIVKTIKFNSSKRETEFVKNFLDTLIDIVEISNINITLKKLQDILRKIVHVYPNILLKGLESKVTMDSLPKHWKLSERHYTDVIKILESQHNELKNCYKDKYIQKLVNNVSKKNMLFTMIMNDMPLEHNEKGIDNDKLIMIYLHLVLESINLYIVTSNLPELEAVTTSINDAENSITDFIMPILDSTGEADIDVLSQEDETHLKSKLVLNLMKMFETELRSINITYEGVMKKTNKSKIEEKDGMTDYLKSMTDEEREVTNLFKNNKLEQWSVGLQKGLFAYDKETYDGEMEKYDMKFMNAAGDIEMLDSIEREREAEDNEATEYNMNNLANDDEFLDHQDGDEQWS